LQAAGYYADSENVTRGIGIKDPHRFISNRDNLEYWKEWIEPEVNDISTKKGGFTIEVEGGVEMEFNSIEEAKEYQAKIAKEAEERMELE
jgi:hypothetical protein